VPSGRLWGPVLALAMALVAVAGTSPRLIANSPAPDLSAYPWLYLRDARPPAGEDGAVELVAVGDVMAGRGVVGVAEPLAEVAPWLAAADLALGNLESVLVEGGTARSGPPGGPEPILLRAPPQSAAELAAAGFDLLGLANNHAFDYGPEGRTWTVARLRSVGITPVEGDPVWRTIRDVDLVFLAFNAVPGPGGERWDPAEAAKAVAAVRGRADAVVVSVHWGYEYEPVADTAQVEAVGRLFAAGADLVVGHHPHVVQGTVAAPGHFAAYSLGNLLFDQEAGATADGLALRVLIDAEGLEGVQALPLRAGVRPRLLAPQEAEGLLARIAPPPRRLAFRCDGDGCELAAAGDGPVAGGLFWSGAVDLTGDGVPEAVRRAAGRVTVREGGTTAWESPAEWEVVDVALGDPNDDGRAELLLALWQRDAEGFLRSQPFIIGHRGGAYQVLWGGRAVAHPIEEVEVGDVDGDGTQELVVIEEVGPGQQAVSVWRWQGWTFGLVWRSEAGRYASLTVLPDEIVVGSPY
jgi:hypothetical protein